MPSEFRQYDEHGFPLAPAFEEIKRHDEEPGRQPKFSVRTKRLALVTILIGVIIPVVFGPQLVSFGRDVLANWYNSRAQKKLLEHDFAGAVQELNCAVSWSPDDFWLRYFRARLRVDQNDLTGSLEDWTQCIRLAESPANGPLARRQIDGGGAAFLSKRYTDRGWIYVRLGQTQEALADINKAVDICPIADNLNTRAYARAILKVDLNEGLADIEKALKEQSNNPEYIDTRGYLLHLLNRNDEALVDLQRAITMLKKLRPIFWNKAINQAETDQAEIDRNLAVMCHHRGLVYQQLGQTEKADHDFKQSESMGYNPALGVF